jgi:hypothetical protein
VGSLERRLKSGQIDTSPEIFSERAIYTRSLRQRVAEQPLDAMRNGTQLW